MGETANYRLDPRAGCPFPMGSPFSKHELAGLQGVGESPPRAVVRRSKLNSFLLAKQGYPDQRLSLYCIGWPARGPQFCRAALMQ